MKIIGEKINGARKRVAQAIADRDAEFIRNLAQKQAQAGAAWLDVNAGTRPDKEVDDFIWLLEIIQSVTEVPLCLDSANPKALSAAIKETKQTPMINSISGEEDRLSHILPLVVEHQCPVIALGMGGEKMPESISERVEIIDMIIAETRRLGLADEKLYVDPLAMTIATNIQSGVAACETIRIIHQKYPQVHFTIGLSNISFGLPARSYVNRAFLTLAMAAGLDSAILDPLDREIQAALVSAELVLGRDPHCLNYTRAFRSGLFDVN